MLRRNINELVELEGSLFSSKADVTDSAEWLAVEALMDRVRGRERRDKYPRYKPLREAVEVWQERSQRSGRDLLGRIWRMMNAEVNFEPLTTPGTVTLTRTEIRAVLASAFWLNSSLDLLSGPDPLYLSSGRGAVEKLVGLLQYFDSDVDEDVVVFERFERSDSSEQNSTVAFQVTEDTGTAALLAPDWTRGPQGQPIGNRVTQSEALITAYPEMYLAFALLSTSPLSPDEVFVARHVRRFVATEGAYHTFKAGTTRLVEEEKRTIVLADAPRSTNPRSREAVDLALRKTRAIHAAVDGVVLAGGCWGAVSFVDPADVVLRVAQLAVEGPIIVPPTVLNENDARRLTILSRALATRDALASDVISLMIDDGLCPSEPFDRRLVNWLRTLPRRRAPTGISPPPERKRPRLDSEEESPGGTVND